MVHLTLQFASIGGVLYQESSREDPKPHATELAGKESAQERARMTFQAGKRLYFPATMPLASMVL